MSNNNPVERRSLSHTAMGNAEEKRALKHICKDHEFVFHDDKLSIAKLADENRIPFFRISPLSITPEEKELYNSPDLYFDIAIGPYLQESGYFDLTCIDAVKSFTIVNKLLFPD